MFLQETPKDWAFQVHVYAYAHTSQPLSEFNVLPHEIVFHTRPRILLTFDINLNRNTSKRVFHNIAPNCLKIHIMIKRIQIHSFTKFFRKLFPNGSLQWKPQGYNLVLQHIDILFKTHAYITKTYLEGKPLALGTFVLKCNFSHIHFSDKLKPLRIGPYKILDRLSDVTYELLSQDGFILTVHRNHLIAFYPKVHF